MKTFTEWLESTDGPHGYLNLCKDSDDAINAAVMAWANDCRPGLYMIQPHHQAGYPPCDVCDCDAHWELAGKWCSFHFAEEAERQAADAHKRLEAACLTAAVSSGDQLDKISGIFGLCRAPYEDDAGFRARIKKAKR